ncbi:uncharacterized protein MKK02DRAFT_42406 [Dioszegia hungarica]|uniref:Uncharacterized protein n=1 Tax=Dioszegia hungarica TaxID=4972 RepID=A0AA38LVK0_9TREE|nr:uncharacterized protein MKK02DRAFT_42406 [Dioszegia hungarica]KAI9638022.1 hypothetical protein MKK02DRAFT_42406 [Dioszegia hungarica]
MSRPQRCLSPEEILDTVTATWSRSRVKGDIQKYALEFASLHQQATTAAYDLFLLTQNEMGDATISLLLEDLDKVSGQRATELKALNRLQRSATSSRGRGAVAEEVETHECRIDQLDKEAEVLEQRLQEAREAREGPIKAYILETKEEALEVFTDFVNSTLVEVGGQRVSMLPETSPAYAWAIAGYTGRWPPTAANVRTEYKAAQGRTETLEKDAEDKIGWAKRKLSRDPDLSARLNALVECGLDWQAPPATWYVPDTDRVNKIYNDAAEARFEVERNTWDILRYREWSRRMADQSYSILGHDIDYKCLMERPSRPRQRVSAATSSRHPATSKLVERTLPPSWAAPITTHSWYEGHREGKRAREEADARAEEIEREENDRLRADMEEGALIYGGRRFRTERETKLALLLETAQLSRELGKSDADVHEAAYQDYKAQIQVQVAQDEEDVETANSTADFNQGFSIRLRDQ